MIHHIQLLFLITLISFTLCVPYDSLICSETQLQSVSTGYFLTLGSHNKSGDFVHMIGDQYVVLSNNVDVIESPDRERPYDHWDICNYGIRNTGNSFFIRADPSNQAELGFTGYMFLEEPYVMVVPVPGLSDAVYISAPTQNCPECVVTINDVDEKIYLAEKSKDDLKKLNQFWRLS